jgi:arsenite-transporting ATPase
VGKTSIAAATGTVTAGLGYRSLVMSLDTAHSLADSFDLDRRLMDRSRGLPVRVADGLDIQEVDVQEEVRRNWGQVKAYVSTLLSVSGLEEVLSEELAILPGMEEVSILLYINQYVKDKTYDVILLDCAPTGESLRFISLPTTLEWYMRRLFLLERNIVRVARPLVSGISPVPLPEDAYFESIQQLWRRLEGVDALLKDPQVTSVRLVTNPEKMVIKETQRAFMYFCLYGLTLDGVIINRILPPEVRDSYFDAWREAQERYVKSAEETFTPLPAFRVPLQGGEVLGLDSLRRLGRAIYGDADPSALFSSSRPYRFEKRDGTYRLVMALPFIDKKDVDLNVRGDELIVRIGTFKRYVPLPRSYQGSSPTGATLRNNELTISFGGGHARKTEKKKEGGRQGSR